MPYQIYQARAAGADAILLIAAILSDQDLNYLSKVASGLGLTILVEVHNYQEFDRVLKIGGFNLIGINNRDLTTFQTDLTTTETLARHFEAQLKEAEILLVSESGLFTRADLNRVHRVGAGAVLVGEALMSQVDIKSGLRRLISD